MLITCDHCMLAIICEGSSACFILGVKCETLHISATVPFWSLECDFSGRNLLSSAYSKVREQHSRPQRPRSFWSAPRIETMSNNGSPRFRDFPSLCACSESSLTNLIGSGLNLLCLQIHSKPECRWTWPEVAILGADQKERGLWGREWENREM